MNVWRILQGDVCERLASLPAESVQTCVTSPPYWGLRDYGTAGQIGLEPTPSEYVTRMVEVFAEVHRVLREDGTLWLNLGDSYAGGGYANHKINGAEWFEAATLDKRRGRQQELKKACESQGIKPKDLVGIPWMVAFALRDYGWYLRSDIIWHKPNPMPESVTDRPTKAHEYLFLLTKSARYYYDAVAVAEPSVGLTSHDLTGQGWQAPGQSAHTGTRKSGNTARKMGDERGRPGSHLGGSIPWEGATRNKRSVWTVQTQPYPEAHFATYPEKLIEPCILAGTSERGQCPACGAPWERVVEREAKPSGRSGDDVYTGQAYATPQSAVWGSKRNLGGDPRPTETIGWQPSCECHAGDPVPQLVLDPFTGSGTTGAVAIRHQRSFVGTELNPAYIDLARKRIGSVAPMFARECGEELVDVLARQA